jgi:hypothetical protein
MIPAIVLSVFDCEIVHHYPCPHADYVRLSVTPGSGVDSKGDDKNNRFRSVDDTVQNIYILLVLV